MMVDSERGTQAATVHSQSKEMRAVDGSETKKSKTGKNFRSQLAALAGNDIIGKDQAKAFNADGFFASYTTGKSSSAKVSSSDFSAKQSRSQEQEKWDSKTEKVAKGNEKILNKRQQNTTGRSIKNSPTSIYPASSPSSSEKVPFAEFRTDPPKRSLPANPKLSPVASQVVDTSSATLTTNISSLADNTHPATNRQASLQKHQIAVLMQQDEFRRNNATIKLAVRELDTGLKLVAEIKHLGRSERENIRTQLLSLLAQHGMGNYDLQLNGESFSNRIAKQ